MLDLPVFLWRRRWLCGGCGHSWRPLGTSSTEAPPETVEAELSVRGARNSYTLILVLLASWLALCLVYYVLRQPSGVS